MSDDTEDDTTAGERGIPIRAISRGIAVLQAINRGSSLSLTEIARSSEVPYPTACRIVQTLLHEGMIEREPNRKRYRPTALVQTLAHGFQGDAHLVRVARPHIVDLTRRLGWPISLTTNIGHSMVIRDSTHALTTLTFNDYHPGFTMPVLECAAGLGYIAHVAEERRREMLKSLRLLPTRVNMHMIALFEEGGLAEQIRREGYSTRWHNRFTRNPGKTSSIAVPIGRGRNVAGMLTLAFFSVSMKMEDAVERFVQPLRDTAAAIEGDL
jgi:IclR family transcriptional regulator, mhp operon transcriptional activator